MSQEAMQPITIKPSDGSEWSFLGWLMVAAGAGLMAWSFFYDVGRDVGVAGLYGRVANTDAVAIRSMILTSGSAVLVSGWIVVAAALVAKAIRRG